MAKEAHKLQYSLDADRRLIHTYGYTINKVSYICDLYAEDLDNPDREPKFYACLKIDEISFGSMYYYHYYQGQWYEMDFVNDGRVINVSLFDTEQDEYTAACDYGLKLLANET